MKNFEFVRTKPVVFNTVLLLQLLKTKHKSFQEIHLTRIEKHSDGMHIIVLPVDDNLIARKRYHNDVVQKPSYHIR